MEKGRNPSMIIAELIEQDLTEVENHFKQWLILIFDNYQIKDFLELCEDNVAWLKMTEIGRFKTVAFEAKYFSKKNLPNYVKMISEIWKDNKGINLFDFFDTVLRKNLNNNFKFLEGFEDIIYSDTKEVIFVILIASILTILYIQQSDEDSDMKIFEMITEMEPESQEFLKLQFKMILELFSSLNQKSEEKIYENKHFITEPSLGSGKRVSNFADIQILKKVEDQQKIIEDLEKENDDMRDILNKVKNDLEEKEKTVHEQEIKIKQLTFSREDLLSKLKNKKFDLIDNEISEKNEEIEQLKREIQILEENLEQKDRDEEDRKDEILKLNLKLENYKKEFESTKKDLAHRQNADNANNKNSELIKNDFEDIKNKYINLQEKSIQDKEKCLHLEVKLGQLKIEIQNLKLENQDLEFKIKELDNGDLGDSEIYLDDLENITEELNSEKYFDEMNKENEDDSSNEKYKKMFKNYEKKCLNRIKILLNENGEYKLKSEEYSKENDMLKDELEEMQEKINDLENNMVGDFISKNKELQNIFSKTNENSSEIAQDLLKNIMKKEHEIERLIMNRRKLREKQTDMEAGNLENIQLIYTLLENYVTV